MNKPKGTREQPSQILHCMLCAAGFLDSVLSYQRHLTNISNRKKNLRYFVVIFYIGWFTLRCAAGELATAHPKWYTQSNRILHGRKL